MSSSSSSKLLNSVRNQVVKWPRRSRAFTASAGVNSRPASGYRDPSVDPLYAPNYPTALPIPQSATAALLARLTLAPTASLQEALLVCLTDPSWDPSKAPDVRKSKADSSPATESEPTPNNLLLANLGNSLLGLYTSEHLSTLYPNLPTRVLQAAVSSYCGPAACFSVGRELGVGVGGSDPQGVISGGGKKGKWASESGVRVRWIRQVDTYVEPTEKTTSNKKNWEDVVADAVRAFVGLVYQEKGINAARDFVHAHFLSRQVDIASLLNFRNPKHVLSVEIRRLMSEAGQENASIQSRLLAESGRNSISPIYNVGLFLPSGLKLSEGFGSSLRMAEHRAATNALISIYTVRGELLERELTKIASRVQPGDTSVQLQDKQGQESAGVVAMLPTSIHRDFPLAARQEGQGQVVEENKFVGNVTLGRAEVVFGSQEGKKRVVRR